LVAAFGSFDTSDYRPWRLPTEQDLKSVAFLIVLYLFTWSVLSLDSIWLKTHEPPESSKSIKEGSSAILGKELVSRFAFLVAKTMLQGVFACLVCWLVGAVSTRATGPLPAILIIVLLMLPDYAIITSVGGLASLLEVLTMSPHGSRSSGVGPNRVTSILRRPWIDSFLRRAILATTVLLIGVPGSIMQICMLVVATEAVRRLVLSRD
jgi:hypothetical protein